MIALERCDWCGRDYYPNQLHPSKHQGGNVCERCRADQGPTHGEIQAEKRKSARANAWNNGRGYEHR